MAVFAYKGRAGGRIVADEIEADSRPAAVAALRARGIVATAVREKQGKAGAAAPAATGGKKLGDQIRGMLTRDLLFDVTADAVGMIVPGGSIAVKLVKAVVDRGK